MKKYSSAETAIELVIENLIINQIPFEVENIRNRVYDWYNHTDVSDPEILAACVLAGKDWNKDATYQDMLNAKDWWFPASPYDEITVWENELAQYDTMWYS